jgi:hypothetical protein
MDTKLTLRLNKQVIDQAKKYAGEHDTSLSKMVENYLEAVVKSTVEENPVSPLVRSLSGVVKLQDQDLDKETYHEHLEKKYSK